MRRKKPPPQAMTSPSIRDKLVLALDFSSAEEALSWVDKTRDWIGMFKVGSQLFTHAGPSIVHAIHARGGKIFLDLKFHDIPNTVAASAEAVVDLGVAIFNVHTSGGEEMMAKCVQAAHARAQKKGVKPPLILGVTVLTSLDDKILKEEIGFQRTAAEQVEHLALLARKSGLDGVVASAQEIQRIHRQCPPPFKILTPGIRASDDPAGDQKRTLTAPEALALGADYLVLGRTITSKPDPEAQLQRIHSESGQKST